MEELFQDIKYYIDLRIKRFKLNMVDNLSAFCSRAISLTAFLLMLLLAMLTLTGALVAAVALWIGSLIWAFVIVGGFYLIAALLFYLLRDRLFTGGMVRTFSRMFFENNSNDTEIEDRQLARLGSVRDLQAAKRRVNRAIREMEESVKDDYEAALEAFSWRDVICYGFSVLDSVQSVVRYMGKGLYTGMTSGIVNGLRRRREKKAARKQGGA